MDEQNKKIGIESSVSQCEKSQGAPRHDERGAKHFQRISISQDRKWLLIDSVTRHFVHVNYMGAILKSHPDLARVGALQPAAQPPSRKSQRARKENDRTS